MPQYLSPGVYVEEVPSAVKPIAGVSTSTAGFIGVVPGTFPIPPSMSVEGEKINSELVDGIKQSFKLDHYPVATDPDSFTVHLGSRAPSTQRLRNEPAAKRSFVDVGVAPTETDTITASYQRWVTDTFNWSLVANNVKELSGVPVSTEPGDCEIKVKGAAVAAPATATIAKKGNTKTYQVTFANVTPAPEADDEVTVKYKVQVTDESLGTGTKDGTTQFGLANEAIRGTLTVSVKGTALPASLISQPSAKQVTVTLPPPRGSDISVDYRVGGPIKNQPLDPGEGVGVFNLSGHPVLTDPKTFDVRVGTTPVDKDHLTIQSASDGKASTVKITGVALTAPVYADYAVFATFDQPPTVGKAVLCTSFSQYKNSFGDFSTDPGQSTLTHAVYGFFNNGGTRCYVTRIERYDQIDTALAGFERVSEIAIVAAPGVLDDNVRGRIVAHCRKMGDRFAIFDSPEVVLPPSELPKLTKINAGSDPGVMPAQTDYAAWYFPWITVSDPVSKMLNRGNGNINVPPSGHIAGVYARVDTERGVHKAPANVPIFGALDVAQQLSKAEQDGVNPKGVNCIRVINNNILVWGARTIGGDDNTDLKYINVRRTLLFLSKSIDNGTQWAVFEPNTPALWQKIARNVTAFLTNVWRSGALFGDTAQQAFYVKCDAETNPPSSVNNGLVVTEVGVAIARPAEFVIFRISQAAGSGK